MAANVTAWLSGTTLNIKGTSGSDNVTVRYDSRLGTTVSVHGREIAKIPNTYTSINADMLRGTDRFFLQAYALNNLESIFVKTGGGVLDVVELNIGSTRNLNIDAKESVGTTVSLNVNVLDEAIVDFGNDNGRDQFYTGVSGGTASFDKLTVKMGAGSDTVVLNRTSIRSLQADMGSDNDTFKADRNTDVISGTVDGGSGRGDTFTKYGSRLNRISIRGVESLRNGI